MQATEVFDPQGTWKWERTFGNNTREHVLRLISRGDRLYGTYFQSGTGDEPSNDAPSTIEDIKLDGNELLFRVTRKFNNREFSILYLGTVDADSIKGISEFNVGGEPRESTWEAKRVNDAAD